MAAQIIYFSALLFLALVAYNVFNMSQNYVPPPTKEELEQMRLAAAAEEAAKQAQHQQQQQQQNMMGPTPHDYYGGEYFY